MHHDNHDHHQKITLKSDNPFDLLLNNNKSNINNNDVISSDCNTSFNVPKSSIELGFQDLSNSGFDFGGKSQIVGGSSSLIGGQFDSKCKSSNSKELGLGFDDSNIQFDGGSNELGLIGDEFSRFDVSNSIVGCSDLGDLGLGLDDGSQTEIVDRSPGLIADDYGECSRYDVSNSMVNCSELGELGLGLDGGSKHEVVERSPRLIGDDYEECGRYEVSKLVDRCSEFEDLGLGLDVGSKPEIVETSPRLIVDDSGECGRYEVSKSIDRCSELEDLGLGLADSNLGFDDGSKTEVVRGSSSLIGEDYGECSRNEVLKSSEEIVRCLESGDLGLGLDDSTLGFDNGSKTEIIGGSPRLIGDDYGECGRGEESKSFEMTIGCSDLEELGLGLDDSSVGFDDASKIGIIEGPSRLIGENYGECSRYEVSKSSGDMVRCSESEDLGLGLNDSFDDGSKTEIFGGSPRLIGEDYGEGSRYEVSKSSEQMDTYSESEDLGFGLHDSNLGFDDGNKTEIVRESSMLIDEDHDKCSSYEVSKSSEKMVRCSESKELGLGLDDSNLGFDDKSQNKSPKNKYEVSKSSGEMVRCSDLDEVELALNNSRPDFDDGNKGETPKNKVLSLSDERRWSPRLINSPNVVNYSECTSFEVSNSSGKLVISSESMELELALNKPGVDMDGKSKSKTPKNKVLSRISEKATRRSPRLTDSSEVKVVDGECGRNASANSSGKMNKCLSSMESGLELNPASVNGKRKMYSLQSSEDQVKTSNKKLKKCDSDIRKGERRSSRLSGLKPEPVVEVEVEVNLGEKASLQLLNSGKGHGSEGKSRTKCLTPSLLMLENMEEKVLRRSPRGLPSTFAVDDDDEWDEIEGKYPKKPKKKKKVIKEEAPKVRIEKSNAGGAKNCFFVGEPIPEQEALQKWGWRYQLKNRRNNGRSLTGNVNEEDDPILEVKCHYTQARIKGCIFNLGDCALIRGDNQKHVGKIVEFFQTTEREDYFRVHWFYKPEDTVMKEAASFHDKKRLFYSSIMNDNLLVCIISKVNVIQVSPQLNFNSSSCGPSDFYYDMEYCLSYSTFRNMPADNPIESSKLPSLGGPESTLSLTSSLVAENSSICETYNAELTMLDLYAGCGGMSTGLCIGAKLSGVNLVTRWAIDADSLACESLRLNHSNIEVKNETAEDFLELLKQWESLCKKFVVEENQKPFASQQEVSNSAEASSDAQSDSDTGADELEVESLVDVCYADTDGSGKRELKFKVRWKGYDPSEDTWEPIEGLSNCEDLIQEFVINGFKNKTLPLPGSVDVICGGPPCQGISGYNRFRSVEAPLDDEKNRQLVVFMDIVEYLRPKFVLMENVMDILRFDKGSLGRYAMSRLVHMKYQARVGIMAAGCYGLPQFRMRAFFWGALPSEELPQFPLPTHDVVVRYWPPAEFERNVVAYDMDSLRPELEDAVFLGDAISDLPAVTNYDGLDEMPYTRPPETEFQKYIRSTKNDKIFSASNVEDPVLYDHRPHQLFEDDYVRVCQIPRRKGANFRDLPGVIVGDDNVVRRDPTIETALLPSGMPLVPEYAFTFEQGKSKRPFARLWWDENVATIVTYPNCHSSAVLHPEQDRVLTVRECARLQGFPDSYRFSGTVKQRYRQVGNAVAIPVAKALGYALGMAFQRRTNKEPLLTLPPKFAYSDHL